jgi:HAD superfamily hydrolase (TIGR01450 family)
MNIETTDALARLRRTRAFLLDMDGTFYLGNKLLDGSLEFLDALAKTGRTALFLTNNSSRSADEYRRKLAGMGVPARFRNVYTSGQAAAEACVRDYPNRRAFLLGTPALAEETARLGVSLDEARPDYVLVGYDTTLDYDKLARLCDFVRAGLPYIATHPDINCPTDGGYAPDIGAIIAFVEASTGRRPDRIIGKPFVGIVEGALRIVGAAADEAAMVGDRLYTDVAAGVNAGLLSILVLTGEAACADIASSDIRPHLIFDRLSSMIPELPQYII